MSPSRKQVYFNYKRLEVVAINSFPKMSLEEISDWMKTPNPVIFDKTPIEVCLSDEETNLFIDWLTDYYMVRD